MKIIRLKLNRITNPLGFELKSLSASWVTEETSAKKQKWARVEVAADPAFQTLLWDSGQQEGLSSVDCPLPIATQPRTRYWWRVTVCADNGEIATSEPAWFETAKEDEPWQGKWITTGQDDIHPLLRRTFTLEEEPVRARIYATGLGLYELSVNGQKAGDEYLAPGCTAYDKWLQYQTYDVTDMLRAGEPAGILADDDDGLIALSGGDGGAVSGRPRADDGDVDHASASAGERRTSCPCSMTVSASPESSFSPVPSRETLTSISRPR